MNPNISLLTRAPQNDLHPIAVARGLRLDPQIIVLELPQNTYDNLYRARFSRRTLDFVPGYLGQVPVQTSAEDEITVCDIDRVLEDPNFRYLKDIKFDAIFLNPSATVRDASKNSYSQYMHLVQLWVRKPVDTEPPDDWSPEC